MKLLIVEDEAHVRERLVDCATELGNGIELVDEAVSGAEAIAILERRHVDIVITDIRMPNMGGLELAGWVKQHYPYCRVIILTGYDDFEYARESIALGVFRFLVKPASNEQLREVILEAKAERERELDERHRISMLEQRWQEYVPQLRGLFYKNWLNDRYSMWEIEKWRDTLREPSELRRMLPIVADMDPIFAGGDRFRVTDRPLVQFALYTIARDIFKEMDSVTFQDDDGMTAIVVFAPGSLDEQEWQTGVHHQIDRLLATAKDCLQLTASAGVGTPAIKPLHLPHKYRQARMALQERVVLGHGLSIPFRDETEPQGAWTTFGALEKELEMAIETGNEEAIRKWLPEVMEAGFHRDIPVADARESLLRMTCLLTRIVHAHGWTLRDALGDDAADFERFYELMTREQIDEWLRRMTFRISRTIAERRHSGTQITVGEVIKYVQERLHDESLSLFGIAEHLYVNYSYLSRIFKKLVGASFSDFVWRLRMEKAKELLANGHKVYETAEAVGYRHVNYFSKAFTKYWGCKPSEVNKS